MNTDKAQIAAVPASERTPLSVNFIERHIGTDEADRDAVLAIVREVESAHNIEPRKVVECLDNDSPWLVCRSCAANGECRNRALAHASDVLLRQALRRIIDEPSNTLSDGKALKAIIRIAKEALASTPTAPAAPETTAPQGVASGPTLSKKDLNKLLNDFAKACAFGDDMLARMAASKSIHEYLDAAFAALAQTGQVAPAAYFDSTPSLHVGDSSFEPWFAEKNMAGLGTKQLARDAYAAGMGDPLVTAKAAPADEVASERDTPIEVLAMRVISSGNYPVLSSTVPVGAELVPFLRALFALAAPAPEPAAPGYVMVPVAPNDALLRPFFACTVSELPLAWDAMIVIAGVQARRALSPQPAPAQQASEPAPTAEPVGYVKQDELDNMLDDRCCLIAPKPSGFRRVPLYASTPPLPLSSEQGPLTDAQIDAVADAMPGGVGGFLKQWGYRQFARSILALRSTPEWEPEFNADSVEQEALALQFCVEIAGKRGQKGSPPDAVRLLEMAEALYKAERKDAAEFFGAGSAQQPSQPETGGAA